MPPPNFTQQDAFKFASPDGVEAAFARLSDPVASGTWLRPGNSFSKGIDHLDKVRKVTKLLRQKDLSEYIAASGPIHCLDGWAYISQALWAHACGNPHAARHFAYYAELRAAVGLLASQGIGIFKKDHYVVRSAQRCLPIPQRDGTHQIAWTALQDWGEQANSMDLLGSVIKPGGIPMQTWLDAFGVGKTWKPVGKDWLKAWGVDVERAAHDQFSRNDASYRPSLLNLGASLPEAEAIEFLGEIAALFVPASSNSPFDSIDRYLLRLTVERAFKGKSGFTPQRANRMFARDVQSMLSGMSLSPAALADWTAFLTRCVEPNDPQILRHAPLDHAYNHPLHHLELISRATLLLRLATGACDRLIDASAVPRNTVAPLLWDMGFRRGILESPVVPPVWGDVWDEVTAAVSTMLAWLRAQVPAPRLKKEVIGNNVGSLSVLVQAERIGFAGLGA